MKLPKSILKVITVIAQLIWMRLKEISSKRKRLANMSDTDKLSQLLILTS